MKQRNVALALFDAERKERRNFFDRQGGFLSESARGRAFAGVATTVSGTLQRVFLKNS
jgi:hypothetical protein